MTRKPTPLVAHQGVDTGTAMKEFDPAAELHYPLLIVKAVNPGCTLELQVEDCRSGRVLRLTTTESRQRDVAQFTEALVALFEEAWTRAEGELT